MVDCVFCKIASGEIPAKIIHEDEHVVAFHDLTPKAPTHFLVIPRQHIATLDNCTSEEESLLGKMLITGKKIAVEGGLSPSGYRFVMNAHSGGGQTVFHIHLHVLGGRQMTWPPG